MALKLKPLHQQVIVITGATSGIGLVTARRAAAAGATVVLAARSESDLDQLADEINTAGAGEGGGAGGAIAVVDVSDPSQVQAVVDAAVTRLGGFDTWVNNAGVGAVGPLETADPAESRQLFDTTFWGQVYGSLAAVKHLKARGGGALINIGSLASDRAFPLQGMYCAAKHAVKGFTDTLRMELEHDGAPISVTLVKPAGVNTPFMAHAPNHLERETKLPPPVYAPEEVAHAILHAAVHPVRDVYIGSGSKMVSTVGRVAPRLMDRIMEGPMYHSQEKAEPARHRTSALATPGGGLRERGDQPGHTHEVSLYTRASLHPWITGMVFGAVGALLAGTGVAVSRHRD